MSNNSLETVFFERLNTFGIRLNEEQREAVRHVTGPLVVFAGPGSGKTTVLTCRASYMMQVAGIPAHSMLVVTFTRAAAEEMKTRLAAMPGLGPQMVRSAEIGTFHSIFMRILLQQSGGRVPQLLEEQEQRQIIRTLLRGQGKDGDDEEVAEALQKIGLCKNNLIMPERIKATKPENQQFKELFAGYEAQKKRQERWDYDDILVHCHALLKSNPTVLEHYRRRFQYILVDEFQDTNLAQYEVIRLLGAHGNVCIVGDDDQSIYRFRGSQVEYLLGFDTLFPGSGKVILATNYRSTDPVIETASRLILHNKKRQSKKIRGTGRAGVQPTVIRPEGERSEAEQILTEMEKKVADGTVLEDIAVLYRTNIQVRAIIDGLVKRNLPFTLHDAEGDFYRRWQVRDVLTYMRLALDPDDLDGLVQIINRPKRYMSADRWVEEAHTIRREKNVTYLEALPHLSGLEPYQTAKLEQLMQDIRSLRLQTPGQALRTIRQVIGYDKYLEEYSIKTGNDLKQVKDPLEELEEAVIGHRTIPDFLAHIAEVAETIRKSRHKGEGVQLMTMHRAKGLEFGHVYCIGLVADMLPHPKALAAEGEKRDAALEEERRLLYVGMTRAKEYLTLSAPMNYHGHRAEVSPFLYETGLVPRPVRVTVSTDSSGTGKAKSKTAAAAAVPANERMKAALDRYGSLEISKGDTLHHKDMGPGIVEEIIPLSGNGGRRVLIKFAGVEKISDLHLELCLYLGLLEASKPVELTQ
ncbi:ATP-dependent helicase [Tumebacillus sp. DT12]|uniref:DNA 3'-5' helicase n=1 Tax=Tumebacillus lacus TaxID=2995335 RepID=A0ABT3X0B2_9BACL|nr:ATP-dependent helicase [Tumebacillus lacus]MCX7568990.1 ATP-dependent helicase [Tumebacillus lacus]